MNTVKTAINHGETSVLFFDHITITSGHIKRQLRCETPWDTAYSMVFVWVNSILSSEPNGCVWSAEIPWCPGFGLQLTPIDQETLLATVTHHTYGVVVTFYVALGDTDSGKVAWETLHQPSTEVTDYMPKIATDLHNPPTDPWCAARLSNAFGRLPKDDQLWIASFELYIAWVWFDLVESIQLLH